MFQWEGDRETRRRQRKEENHESRASSSGEAGELVVQDLLDEMGAFIDSHRGDDVIIDATDCPATAAYFSGRANIYFGTIHYAGKKFFARSVYGVHSETRDVKDSQGNYRRDSSGNIMKKTISNILAVEGAVTLKAVRRGTAQDVMKKEQEFFARQAEYTEVRNYKTNPTQELKRQSVSAGACIAFNVFHFIASLLLVFFSLIFPFAFYKKPLFGVDASEGGDPARYSAIRFLLSALHKEQASENVAGVLAKILIQPEIALYVGAVLCLLITIALTVVRDKITKRGLPFYPPFAFRFRNVVAYCSLIPVFVAFLLRYTYHISHILQGVAILSVGLINIHLVVAVLSLFFLVTGIVNLVNSKSLTSNRARRNAFIEYVREYEASGRLEETESLLQFINENTIE